MIREDFSSFHAFEFNSGTGEPLRGFTHQGMSDDSCWSRGQAWAIHGLAQSYLNTGITKYRDTAASMADYIAGKLPGTASPSGTIACPPIAIPIAIPPPVRSSRRASMRCAMLRLRPNVAKYTALADHMLLGLVEHCDISAVDGAEGQLREGAAFVDLGRADNLLPSAHYYYLEALMRAVGHTEFPW